MIINNAGEAAILLSPGREGTAFTFYHPLCGSDKFITRGWMHKMKIQNLTDSFDHT